MSTENINPKVIYNGNGTQTEFDFRFPATSVNHIKVHLLRAGGDPYSRTEIDYGDDYEFLEEPTGTSGGKIKFPATGSTQAVLRSGDKLCIMRDSELGNDFVFSNQTRLLPQSVEDADDSLSLQILDLSNKLAMSVQASPFDTRTPKERMKEIVDELRKAQNILVGLEMFEDVPRLIATERQERIEGDSALAGSISANKSDADSKIGELNDALETEKAERISADNTAVKKETVGPAVVIEGAIQPNSSTVCILLRKISVNTGNTVDTTLALPVASEARHGIMPKEAYKNLTELTSRVSTLEGGQAKTYAIYMGEGPFTQQDYQDAWELAAGAADGATPPDGTKISNLTTNIDIQYFASQSAWIERQTYIPLATHDSTGAVKGSNTNGKIAVEQDGSMSLNGYDALVSKGNTNTSAISAETTRATNSENSINQDLQSHKNNTTVHITASERTAWNGKYAKPGSGIPADDLASAVQAKLNDSVTKSGGGTLTAKVVARNANPTELEVRNIKAVAAGQDPGVGSALASGDIILVYE